MRVAGDELESLLVLADVGEDGLSVELGDEALVLLLGGGGGGEVGELGGAGWGWRVVGTGWEEWCAGGLSSIWILWTLVHFIKFKIIGRF